MPIVLPYAAGVTPRANLITIDRSNVITLYVPDYPTFTQEPVTVAGAPITIQGAPIYVLRPDP